MGALGGIAQYFPQALDGRIQPVLEIHECVRVPQALPQIVAGNQFPGMLNQFNQYLKGLLGKLGAGSIVVKFSGAEVQLEGAEADGVGGKWEDALARTYREILAPIGARLAARNSRSASGQTATCNRFH